MLNSIMCCVFLIFLNLGWFNETENTLGVEHLPVLQHIVNLELVDKNLEVALNS